MRGNLLSERGLEDEAGFVGLASELVQYDAAYEGVVRSLARAARRVAEDLDYAVAIARKYGYRFRVVTLDGQVVNAGGSMTGGSSVKGCGLLSRRAEIERIREEAAALAQKAQAAKDAFGRRSRKRPRRRRSCPPRAGSWPVRRRIASGLRRSCAGWRKQRKTTAERPKRMPARWKPSASVRRNAGVRWRRRIRKRLRSVPSRKRWRPSWRK